MPLKIRYTIQPAVNGQRAYVELEREYSGDDLQLQPIFSFKKTWELPCKVYRGTNAHLRGQECKGSKQISLHIRERRVGQPGRHHFKVVCMQACDGCKKGFYLPLRYNENRNFADIIAVFEQVARDLSEEWNRAVAAAREAREQQMTEARRQDTEPVTGEFSSTALLPEPIAERPVRNIEV